MSILGFPLIRLGVSGTGRVLWRAHLHERLDVFCDCVNSKLSVFAKGVDNSERKTRQQARAGVVHSNVCISSGNFRPRRRTVKQIFPITGRALRAGPGRKLAKMYLVELFQDDGAVRKVSDDASFCLEDISRSRGVLSKSSPKTSSFPFFSAAISLLWRLFSNCVFERALGE
jgi:hypothetical protein